jgi:hypothetical protein
MIDAIKVAKKTQLRLGVFQLNSRKKLIHHQTTSQTTAATTAATTTTARSN